MSISEVTPISNLKGEILEFVFWVDHYSVVAGLHGSPGKKGGSLQSKTQLVLQPIPVMPLNSCEPITVKHYSTFWKYVKALPLATLRTDYDSGLHFFRKGAIPTWEANPKGGVVKIYDYQKTALPMQQCFEKLCVSFIFSCSKSFSKTASCDVLDALTADVQEGMCPFVERICGVSSGLDCIKFWLFSVEDLEDNDIIEEFTQFASAILEPGCQVKFNRNCLKLPSPSIGPTLSTGSGGVSPSLSAQLPPTSPLNSVYLSSAKSSKKPQPKISATFGQQRANSEIISESSWNNSTPLLQRASSTQFNHQRSDSLSSAGTASTTTSSVTGGHRRRGSRGGKKVQQAKNVDSKMGSEASSPAIPIDLERVDSGYGGEYSFGGNSTFEEQMPTSLDGSPDVRAHDSYNGPILTDTAALAKQEQRIETSVSKRQAFPSGSGESDTTPTGSGASGSTSNLPEISPVVVKDKREKREKKKSSNEEADDGNDSVVERDVDETELAPQYRHFKRTSDELSITPSASPAGILVNAQKPKPKRGHQRQVSFEGPDSSRKKTESPASPMKRFVAPETIVVRQNSDGPPTESEATLKVKEDLTGSLEAPPVEKESTDEFRELLLEKTPYKKDPKKLLTATVSPVVRSPKKRNKEAAPASVTAGLAPAKKAVPFSDGTLEAINQAATEDTERSATPPTQRATVSPAAEVEKHNPHEVPALPIEDSAIWKFGPMQILVLFLAVFLCGAGATFMLMR